MSKVVLGMTMSHSGTARLELAHWRASVAELYAAVRRSSDAGIGTAWKEFRAARSALLRSHPRSPLAAAAQAELGELAYFPPVLLGDGKALCKGIAEPHNLRLIKSDRRSRIGSTS